MVLHKQHRRQHNVAPGNILHRLLNEFWIASKFTRGMDLQ